VRTTPPDALALSFAQLVGGEELVLRVPQRAGALDAVVVSQEDEIERRRTHGLGAITDPMVIEACTALPLGLPVPVGQVDPISRVVLDACPPGVVDVVDGSYIRLWRPAVEAVSVSLFCRATSWRPALGLLSTGVGLADRNLLVEGRAVPGALIDRAERLRIGVVAVTDGRLDVVCRPVDHPLRPGSRRWAFLEAAYERQASITGSSPRRAAPSEVGTRRPSGAQASRRP
jgi:hypothetical protein